MIWAIVNSAVGLVVAGIITYKLVWRDDTFTQMELYGMGLVASGCVLTIGPLLYVEPTPFEDWSGTVLRVGCAVYFIGRLLKHRHNNAAMRKTAKKHLGRER